MGPVHVDLRQAARDPTGDGSPHRDARAVTLAEVTSTLLGRPQITNQGFR